MLVRAAVLGVLVVAPMLSACNDDGRTLRPARPDQNASVSTLAPVTDPTNVVDGGLGFDTVAPASTLPPAPPTLVAPFTDGSPIDPRHTCDGDDVSPALNWTAAPIGTVEIALTLTDLDAGDYVHWAMAGIDPLATALGEGVVPEFALTSINSAGTSGYSGPCPPAGETHTYQFTVHFLSVQTELADGAPGADMRAAINNATFEQASVTATYERVGP